MTSGFITVTWHAVGIMLLSVGIILLLLARSSLGADGAVTVRGVGAIFAATTLMVFWLARRRPRSLVRAPMWLLFVATAALCWLGAAT
jgi:predicted CDP-diglyceride synthetase/phosphatidate cytidylyltransferase